MGAVTDDTAPTTVSGELLGFAPDARVLIVNCDDFGMYHAVNSAVVASIEDGIAASCSLMVPCPWASHGMRLLRERPQIPFGIHLTLVRDTTDHRWGPLSAKDRVPSLLDDAGELFTPAGIPELLGRARPEEIEREFRAQIDAVVDTGLRPTQSVRRSAQAVPPSASETRARASSWTLARCPAPWKLSAYTL